MSALTKILNSDSALPRKISPCPIVEAVVELRFEPSVDPEAVYGLLYGSFKRDYPKTEKLGVLQIPEAIRLQDPDLRYTPWFKFRNGSFIVQLSPWCFSIVSQGEYAGWTTFFERLKSGLTRLHQANVVKKLERFGMRYINFFEGDVFQNLKLSLDLDGSPIETSSAMLKTAVQHEDYSASVRINNEVWIPGLDKKGGIVDIDIAQDPVAQDFFADPGRTLNLAHDLEKRLFFSLLKEDFIKKTFKVEN